MPKRLTVTIRQDKKCAECGKGFAADNGLCLKCTSNAMDPRRRMKSVNGRAVQARFKETVHRFKGRG